jgi:ATP-dependent Clp protease ATP-binding subunit ClpA
MTSNLGANAMRREIAPDFGFAALAPYERRGLEKKLQGIGMGAVRRRFSPEFINRIDAIITYQPLKPDALKKILDQQMEDLQRHIDHRLTDRAFGLNVTKAAKDFLLARGTSDEFGARELKRTILRHLTQPLAAMVANGEIEPGAVVKVEVADGDLKISHE